MMASAALVDERASKVGGCQLRAVAAGRRVRELSNYYKSQVSRCGIVSYYSVRRSVVEKCRDVELYRTIPFVGAS